ncbi:hypothetical protein CASFOL_016741 [Castilleja foliolosa]|uniref:Peptidase A1 domain-containing protein n=1 Tax=Castilleja foliolosa TaxID=1961234 RepID=A0ABD3DAD3_9LAMI
MYVKALVLYLLTWITSAYQQDPDEGTSATGSSTYFPIKGNVYPIGTTYIVTIDIGSTEKSYILDVDTGSDVTWIQNSSIYDNPYVPKLENIVSCDDPACISLQGVLERNCDIICDYKVDYGDGSSFTGSLVRDSFHLTMRIGSWLAPNLTFGCGISIKDGYDTIHHSTTDGVLGLGKGKSGILNQLRNKGVINRNVVGHCLYRRGGGYLILGEFDFGPMSWKQISSNEEHYSLGKANILLGNETTDIKNLSIIFDSGSSYTYLESRAYEALFDLVNKTINGSLIVADDDKILSICWKDVVGPIQTFADVINYFLPVALNFTDEVNNVQFEIPPESYLIISDKQNVCLGMLNGTEAGLEDVNLIGGISMQDKFVVYDNENNRVGWSNEC